MSTKNLPSDVANAASTYVAKPSGGVTGQTLLKQSDGSVAWGMQDSPYGSTMLDVSLGTGNGTTTNQSIPGGVFTTINMPTVTTDGASGYNSTTALYTVPATGTYLIIAKVRPLDGTGTTSQSSFGLGVSTANADFPGFVWTTRGAPSTGAGRWVPDYQRLAMFTAGQQIRLFVYADIGSGNNMGINSANLTMIRIA